MIIRTHRFAPIILIASAFAYAPLAAAEESIFAGATVGQSELKDFRLATTSMHDTEEVGEIFVGYQFTPFFATTLGYIDLGEYNAAGPDFGGYTADLESRGFHLNAIGIAPVSPRVAAFATAGVFFWDYDFHGTDDENTNRRLSDSGESLTYGLGLNVDVGGPDGINLHITWQRFDTVGDRQTVEHENDYDLFLLGATWHFGP